MQNSDMQNSEAPKSSGSPVHGSSLTADAAPGRLRWRRAFVASSIVCVLTILLTVTAPLITLQTSLRNALLNSAFAHYGLSTTCESADGGWTTPLTFYNVRIIDPEERFRSTVNEIRLTRGLWGLLTNGDDPGLITLNGPRVELHADENGHLPLLTSETKSSATFPFLVHDGALLVTVPWRELPIVDLEELDFDGSIARTDKHSRVLRLSGFQVFDHEPLSDAHSHQNLALVAPVLSQSTRISGEASAWVEPIEIRLPDTNTDVS
ncbi:MAG: hypothetical protein KDA96_23135, partial [Planctomycetaceae bacterium]|nr:hypothetical protein [Planctomycetaceae bacterium]